MKDALVPVVRTGLDLHFGRLVSRTPDTEEEPLFADAALTLARRIGEHLLRHDAGAAVDAGVMRYALGRDDVLPAWLVNRGLVASENDRASLEPALLGVLDNEFNQRRYFDYVAGEMLYHRWRWLPETQRKPALADRVGDARDNPFCIEINTFDYVLKFNGEVLGKALADRDVLHWYVRSIGSVVLLPLVTKPVFEFTARLVEAKYKTPFILTLFKSLFTKAGQLPPVDRYGVLVLGDILKLLGLRDYHNAARQDHPELCSGNVGVLELLRHILDRFDNPTARMSCDARFRLGGDPPQSLINRLAALYWLRRTLDAAKAIQGKKAAPARGMRVEERTVLEAAFKQKSILYFRLFDDPNDSAINPCHIKALDKASMVVQSPRGNRLNEAGPGQEVHGYFSITGANRKSTYLDFRSNVLAVEDAEPSYCLVELTLPAAFELTRRSHKRLPLDPSQLAAFEMAAPPPGADWTAFSNLEKWPAPFCIIPDSASHCHIKDLSAGGLMLEIHQDAPAHEYFNERNKDYPLLASMHLVGRTGIADLKLGLRLDIKRIRDFPPLRKKYVGFQFVEAGEIRHDRLVRFAPVGKDGIFLIDDWIFRNSIGR
ncbi:pilus assembly protein PilZ [Solidesulfovibrio sp.]|uniref:pilus assembly protein PilZ n=1 Tax=Solidesulfovibrio sp. TaxID=2910990 RepID=UPI002B1FC53B|nr:pilus assembly protein PilZ [Solidesulfovibrio sp.]MEA4855152.1 pilus assembly protein PilZ [Solidesulfovibrio sp.]